MRRALRLLLAVAGLEGLGHGPVRAQQVRLLVPMDTLIAWAVRDSVDAPAQYNVGMGYWLHRDFDRAESHLRRAIAIEPHLAAAYLALSYLPYARRPKLWSEEDRHKVPAEWQSRVDEAWQFRRQAFLIDPLVDLKPLALMIVPASALGLRGNRGAAYTSFMNGLGSFWDGQYGRAADFLHELAGKVTEADRQRFASWFLWYEALAAAHVGDFGLAAGDLRILLARAEARDTLGGGAMLAFSNANHYRYTLACVLDIGGQSQAALLLLQEVATQDAGLYMAHTRMAGIYDGLHRPVAALEERKRAVAANPDDGTLLFELGDALARAGEFADAQGALRQARHANPRNVRALYLLGMVASQVGDIDEAQDAFRQFLVLAPSRFSDQKAEVTLHLEKLR